MSTEIQKPQTDIEIWNNNKADKIRKLFAPNLTNDEFAFFWGLGKSLEANPFTREIWAVKYDKNKPAQIFLGRDFYRKKAQEQPDYDGHIVDAVYEKDEFRVESGTPKHSYNLTSRGKLLGAYCVVYKKDISNAFYVYAELGEYHKGQSTWNEKPATMIKKVAEAQALRGAYQGIFRGTYDESEQWQEEVQQPTQRQPLDFSDEGQEDTPKVESETDSDNGNNEDVIHDKIDREQIMADITKHAKKAFGSKWLTELKKVQKQYNPKAETMMDLTDDSLQLLHSEITETEAVEA